MSHNEETPKQETPAQKSARLKKQLGLDKKPDSLMKMLMESDLYDYKPGRFAALLVLAHGLRVEKEDYSNTWIQEDCPYTAEEMVGWCDFAQWRLALRAKKSESQIQKDIKQFKKDGVIEIRHWEDSNGADHNAYKFNVDVVKDHKRPAQKPDVERPGRYRKKSSSRGRFTSENQPKKKQAAAAMAAMGVVPGMDDEDEL
jgi:hypothetical protein